MNRYEVAEGRAASSVEEPNIVALKISGIVHRYISNILEK